MSPDSWPKIFQELLGHLKRDPEDQVAAVLDGTCVYFARMPLLSHAPVSPVTLLLQGLWEKEPEQSRRILRNRIYLTYSPTEMCKGMMCLVAKRHHVLEKTTPVPSELSAQYTFVEVTFPQLGFESLPNHDEKLMSRGVSHEDFMQTAVNLAGSFEQENKPLHACDRPIASVLVSASHDILSWGVNKTAKNKTLHAEVAMIQNYWRKTQQPLPQGCRIYTSLKPCRMCAGMIWTTSPSKSAIQVFYGEDDQGSKAKQTVLTRKSPLRRAAALTLEEWEADMEIFFPLPHRE